MSEKVITEATMKRIAESLKKQRIALDAISRGWKISDWGTVQDLVQSGLAQKYFAVGDQFFVDWKDGVNSYPKVPWDVKHFCTVKDQDGAEHQGMVLQWHWATPFEIQYDAPENKPCEDETFQEGYYYYLKQDNGFYVQQEVQVGDPVPEEGEYVRSPFAKAQDVIRSGYNRWSHSAYRQWLNSDAEKGNWWTAQHDGDMPPTELTKHDGFMKGLPEDFLAVVKPVQIKSYKNTVTDDGEFEITNDRFFLPSVEEVFGTPQLIGEGEPWQYWVEATGFEVASNAACSGRVTYGVENNKIAMHVRLRSANRSESNDTLSVYSNGQVLGYGWGAGPSCRCSPACIIY